MVDSERLMSGRFSQIAIDDENRGAKLRKGDRRVYRGERLPFARLPAGYENGLGWIACRAQQNGCSQHAIGFGSRRTRIERCKRRGGPLQSGRRGTVGAERALSLRGKKFRTARCDRGNDPERGQLRVSIHVLDRLDRVVEVFKHEGKADSGDETQEQADQDSSHAIRPYWSAGRLRRFDNSHVVVLLGYLHPRLTLLL